MNTKKTRVWLLVLAAVGMLLTAAPAMAVPVSLELLLLVDISGSIDATEYNLQKQGYVQAFQNPTIQANIASFAGSGGIAVAYAEWSGFSQQYLKVGWTQLDSAADANAFAAAIGAASRGANFNLTAPGSAINYGAGLFTNTFEGTRRIIDISGDGSANDGANTFTAATNAWNAGIKLNGLAILGSETGLGTWYQNNIVTPGNGTLYTAASFADFGTALETKIGQEITGVPEPGTLLLLGSGLVGLAGFGRKRTI